MMKTTTFQNWFTPARLLILAVVFGLSACSSSDDSTLPFDPDEQPEPEPASQNFEVQLGGEQQVPNVQTDQSAMATVTIDETDMMLMAEMDLSDVSEVTAAHIHAGEVGLEGPEAFEFSGPDADGVWTIEGENITEAQHEELLAGGWYINVHTDSYPDGELRGQILTDTQTLSLFSLSGEQQVPTVNTDALGEGYLLHDSHNDALTLNVWTRELAGDAAHIHQAEAGINGDVIAELEASTDTEGLWQLPSDAMLSSDEVSALSTGELYVNVHSEAHPDGEIRGQILPDDYELVLFEMSPGQQVPRADSQASGRGYATLNTQTGGLQLNAWASDMEPNAAQIRQGGIGVNGDVAIDLEANTDHDGLWQTPVNTALDSATQEQLLAGGHYLNMHSDNFPDGEIRGQITPTSWSLLEFTLNGSQVVPAVATEAEGDGYAMVNTETGEVNMVVNSRNLDTATAAHVRANTAGANCDVVFGLEQDGADTAVWRSPADTFLDAAAQEEFLDAGHYVDIDSPEHPDGEMRGQILTSNHTMFPLSLSGDHEVPPVETMASGNGALTLNNRTGSLRGAFTTNDLTSNAAHIHQAPVGENGDAVIDLEVTESGYQVPAGTMLSEELRATMLDAGHYVNVHSDAFPDGELRGQIMQ